MLQHDVKRLLREQLRELGERAARVGDAASARRAFERLNEGGVRALTPLGWKKRSLLELAVQRHRFRRVFGLDGGSTRPIHFTNGWTLCANQAVLVSDPALELKDRPLEAWRTIALVSHSWGASGAPRAEYREEGSLGLWRVHITRDYLRRDVDHVVKGLADSASEGRHALRMAALLDLGRDDLLILDGNVFPIGLYYYLVGERDRELADWEGISHILAHHLRLAEELAERGVAYLGVNKSPRTADLIHQLELPDQVWADDHQFIAALFRGEVRKGELGYTNWFVQERYRFHRGHRDTGMDLFRGLRERLHLAREPDDYHVAFFFVYDPRLADGQGSVLKIETPLLTLREHDPTELQQAVLAELARGSGVPNVLRRADARARITQREREALMALAGLPPDLGYNQGRGEPW